MTVPMQTHIEPLLMTCACKNNTGPAGLYESQLVSSDACLYTPTPRFFHRGMRGIPSRTRAT